MQQMRFRRVAIIIKSTYIPLHTTGLRVLRKPSSEPGSPESEHRIGTSHDNGIKLELSIRASATHVEERTARMTDLERIRAKFAAEYGLSEDMLRNAERWTETTGDLEGVPENLLPGILGMRFGAIAIDTPRSERWSTPEDIDVIADLATCRMAGTIRPRERAAAICSTCICRMTRYCAVGTPCRCTSISMAADSLTDTRS